MNYKDHSLEEPKPITCINRDEKQGEMVAPLSSYKTVSDQIGDYIMEQINVSDDLNSDIFLIHRIQCIQPMYHLI